MEIIWGKGGGCKDQCPCVFLKLDGNNQREIFPKDRGNIHDMLLNRNFLRVPVLFLCWLGTLPCFKSFKTAFETECTLHTPQLLLLTSSIQNETENFLELIKGHYIKNRYAGQQAIGP
jgi:hypothetical protein